MYRTNSVLQDLPEFSKSFSFKKTAAKMKPEPRRILYAHGFDADADRVSFGRFLCSHKLL